MAEPAGELPPLMAEPPAVPEPAAEPVAEPVLEPVAQPAAPNQVTFRSQFLLVIYSVVAGPTPGPLFRFIEFCFRLLQMLLCNGPGPFGSGSRCCFERGILFV